MSALDTESPPVAISPTAEADALDAAHKYLNADIARTGQAPSMAKYNVAVDHFRQQYGLQPKTAAPFDSRQYEAQNAAGNAADNTTAQNIGGHVGQAGVAIPNAIKGITDPTGALRTRQDAEQAFPADPNSATKYVRIPIQAAALIAAGPAAIPYAAADAAGNRRIDIAQQRENGQQISGGAEAVNVVGSAGLAAATVGVGGKVGEVGTNLLGKAVPAIGKALAPAAGRAIPIIGRAAIGATGGAAEGVTQTVAQNALNRATTDNPNHPTPLLEGAGVGGSVQGIFGAYHGGKSGIPIKGRAPDAAVSPPSNAQRVQEARNQAAPGDGLLDMNPDNIRIPIKPKESPNAAPVRPSAPEAAQPQLSTPLSRTEIQPAPKATEAQVRRIDPLADLNRERDHVMAEMDRLNPRITKEQAAKMGHPELEGQTEWHHDGPVADLRDRLYELNGKIADRAREYGIDPAARSPSQPQLPEAPAPQTPLQEKTHEAQEVQPSRPVVPPSDAQGAGKQADSGLQRQEVQPEKVLSNAAKDIAAGKMKAQGEQPDLSTLTKKAYRQMDTEELRTLFKPGAGIKFAETHLASTPEMATGQGRNAGGVTVEFDPAGIKGLPNMRKPSAGFAAEQGHQEFTTTAQPSELGPRIKSVTVPKGVGLPPIVERRMAGWETKDNADGSRTYTKPAEAKPVAPSSVRRVPKTETALDRPTTPMERGAEQVRKDLDSAIAASKMMREEAKLPQSQLNYERWLKKQGLSDEEIGGELEAAQKGQKTDFYKDWIAETEGKPTAPKLPEQTRELSEADKEYYAFKKRQEQGETRDWREALAEFQPKPKLGPGTGEGPGTPGSGAELQAKVGNVSAENAPKVLRTAFSPEAQSNREATLLGRIAAGDFRGAKGVIASHANAVIDSLKRYASISFPALTREHSPAGEAAAALTATRETIKYQPKELTNSVLGEIGAKPGDALDTKLGAVISEDQLRGIRSDFQDAADAIRAKLSKDPSNVTLQKELTKAQDKVANVRTLVGAPDSPFKTEAEYRAALNDPKIVDGIVAHRSFVEPILEQNYRLSSKMADSENVHIRGRDTNTHLSLKAIQEGEPTDFSSKALKTGAGLRNTLEKHSPFEQAATGTGEQYETRYSELVKNGVEKGALPAAQARLYKTLVDGGVAKYRKIGEPITIDGEPTTALDTRRRTLITPNGPVADNQRLYVKNSVISEVKAALKQDSGPQSTITRGIAGVNNNITLASGVEAISHAANHLGVLYKVPIKGEHLPTWAANIPGVKAIAILDSVGTKAYQMLTRNPAVEAELSKLAQISALKPENDLQQSKANPLRYMGKTVDFLARAARLSLNDSFDLLAKSNPEIDTPTKRRDFINQVGQYHAEANSASIRMLKKVGLSPFATAGTTFYTQGLRTLAGDIGVSGGSRLQNAKYRAMVYGQLGGTLAMVALANYLRTGKIQPAGTPWGSLYLGDDKDGKPRYEDVADIIGAKRGLRALGADAAIEGVRNNALPGDIAQKSFRQASSSALSPIMGPLPSATITASTGINPHGMYKAGDPGSPEALKAAAENVNPTLAALAEKGATSDFVTEQTLGKFGPRTGTNPDRIPQSKAEAMIGSFNRAQAGPDNRTPEQRQADAKRSTAIAAIAKSYVANLDEGRKAFQQAVKDGTLTANDSKAILKHAELGPLHQLAVGAALQGGIPLSKALEIYDAADDEQKTKALMVALIKRLENEKDASVTPGERLAARARIQADGKRLVKP